MQIKCKNFSYPMVEDSYNHIDSFLNKLNDIIVDDYNLHIFKVCDIIYVQMLHIMAIK